jgi:hypothetical protein
VITYQLHWPTQINHDKGETHDQSRSGHTFAKDCNPVKIRIMKYIGRVCGSWSVLIEKS